MKSFKSLRRKDEVIRALYKTIQAKDQVIQGNKTIMDQMKLCILSLEGLLNCRGILEMLLKKMLPWKRGSKVISMQVKLVLGLVIGNKERRKDF